MYKPKHLKYDVKATMRRFRVQVVTLTLVLLLALTAAVALAAPDFGPGQTQDVKPHAPNAKCHPPGQELPSPECEE